MRNIKFGIVGLGYVAVRSVIPAIIKCKNALLISVYDIDNEKSKSQAISFDCHPSNTMEELLSQNIDAVYISTPIGTHFDIAMKATEAGKHILCEKSLTISLNETRILVEKCKKLRLALMEGFMYQFHTQHQEVRNVIASGDIGKPILFQAWFGFPPLAKDNFRYSKKLGGGAILDAGAYVIHAARTFFKREPISIHSCISSFNQEVETNGTVLMDFGEGQTAVLAFGFNNFYKNSYSIWGTKGQLTLDRAFSIPAEYRSKLTIEKQDQIEIRTLAASDHFLEEIKHFVDNLDDYEIRKHRYKDALKQAEILEKIDVVPQN
jgi:dTDP-3,4-didehydro-2,6-dideoxy-alpha-D-glucose 3-reductase